MMQHDFECADHGSIATITPLTEAAADWISENVEPSAIGFPLYAEPRYSLDIALGMIDAGLTCENSHLVGEFA
jgi:hypothetical protein